MKLSIAIAAVAVLAAPIAASAAVLERKYICVNMGQLAYDAAAARRAGFSADRAARDATRSIEHMYNDSEGSIATRQTLANLYAARAAYIIQVVYTYPGRLAPGAASDFFFQECLDAVYY